MEININDQVLSIDDAHNDTPLLWVLRDVLKLKGTKYGCGIGACGSCTVLVEDLPVRSCLIAVKDINGKKITTIESFIGAHTHPVQKAWEEFQVPQCGYCQSGQILTAIALLNNNKNPDDEAIKHAMNGVLCRCGTYPRILKAIKAASKAVVE